MDGGAMFQPRGALQMLSKQQLCKLLLRLWQASSNAVVHALHVVSVERRERMQKKKYASSLIRTGDIAVDNRLAYQERYPALHDHMAACQEFIG